MTRLMPALPAAPPRGVRVVLDARPMQEPDRSPLTAWYLDQLLRGFAAEPLEDESFVLITRALRPDPSAELARAGLTVAASRRVPPTTRALRSAGLTLDSFLLRGAEIGATGSAAGDAVFHTAGGAVPLASQLPVVATLLDLAPWELPETYAASAAARFGHRLRARVLRDAARVIVCSRATGESARRRIHLPADRIAVVPLAVGDDFAAAARDHERLVADRARLSMPPRYLAFAGRYDARKDIGTLFRAMSQLRLRSGANGNGRRAGVPTLVIAVEQGQEQERALVARAIESNALGDAVIIVDNATARERAAIMAGAEAFVYPALSEAAGLSALEALHVGVPVVSSRAGVLPEVVGSAGIVVEPRDPSRMAAALEAIWAGGSLAQQLRRQARRRSETPQRTWSDVCRETRTAYAAAARSAGRGPSSESAPRSGFGRFALR